MFMALCTPNTNKIPQKKNQGTITCLLDSKQEVRVPIRFFEFSSEDQSTEVSGSFGDEQIRIIFPGNKVGEYVWDQSIRPFSNKDAMAYYIYKSSMYNNYHADNGYTKITVSKYDGDQIEGSVNAIVGMSAGSLNPLELPSSHKIDCNFSTNKE